MRPNVATDRFILDALAFVVQVAEVAVVAPTHRHTNVEVYGIRPRVVQRFGVGQKPVCGVSAQAADSTSACSNTVSAAFSRLSGG